MNPDNKKSQVPEALGAGQPTKYVELHTKAIELAALIEKECPVNWERSIVLDYLETAVMWANASIVKSEKPTEIMIEQMAMIVHETKRAYGKTVGDNSYSPWDETPGDQKNPTINSVTFLLQNPLAPVETLHDEWVRFMIADGWTFGSEKDDKKKTHPCLVAYEELPKEQKVKNFLFRNIIHTLFVTPDSLG
jgi:hypothetical protein